jgi:DNA-binding transcriptional MerR regulator
MLRYLERTGLVTPSRTPTGYRVYGIRELNQLRGLSDLRRRFGVELDEVAFALRLRREPSLARARPLLTGSSGSSESTSGCSSPDNYR